MKKVLWTGGWDSTFRVLDAVINKKLVIKPYYIVDEDRKSSSMEIRTMKKIISMVKQIDIQKRGEILDIQIIQKKDIPPYEELTVAYKKLKSQSYLGNQYDWLARYCHFNDLTLELCIHKDDNVGKVIRGDAILIDGDDPYYKLQDNLSQPAMRLFTYFNYPLFEISKLDMEVISKESGFNHIMEETWFCHTPYKDSPCGMCNPCKYTREEGLGRRVPEPTIAMKINRKINSKMNGIKRRLNFS